jgi:hypothetical protein
MAEQLTTQNAPDWIAWVTDFDKTRKVWLDSWWALKSRLPWIEKNAPHLLASHKAIMQKFLDQVPQIEAMERFRHNLFQGFAMIGQAVQNVANFTGITAGIDWLRGTFGLNGLERERSNLGAAQVVWLGVSLASAAALLISMAGVANEGFKQMTRVDAYKLALERGASPEQAAAAVNAALGQPGDGQFLGLPIREALLAAVLIFALPPVVNMISEGRKK